MTDNPDYCQFQVPVRPWYIRTYQCNRKHTMTVGKKKYCTQHGRMVEKRNRDNA